MTAALNPRIALPLPNAQAAQALHLYDVGCDVSEKQRARTSMRARRYEKRWDEI
jgi:hypothetical protein